jgi:hypothetical protein
VGPNLSSRCRPSVLPRAKFRRPQCQRLQFRRSPKPPAESELAQPGLALSELGLSETCRRPVPSGQRRGPFITARATRLMATLARMTMLIVRIVPPAIGPGVARELPSKRTLGRFGLIPGCVCLRNLHHLPFGQARSSSRTLGWRVRLSRRGRKVVRRSFLHGDKELRANLTQPLTSAPTGPRPGASGPQAERQSCPGEFSWLWRLALGCSLALAMVLGSELLTAASPGNFPPVSQSQDASPSHGASAR